MAIAEANRLGVRYPIAMVGRARHFAFEASQGLDLKTEGWVLRHVRDDGVIVREKVVRVSWTRAKQASMLINPLLVARSFCANPDARSELLTTHHALERERMHEALGYLFLQLRDQLHAHLIIAFDAFIVGNGLEDRSALWTVTQWKSMKLAANTEISRTTLSPQSKIQLEKAAAVIYETEMEDVILGADFDLLPSHQIQATCERVFELLSRVSTFDCAFGARALRLRGFDSGIHRVLIAIVRASAAYPEHPFYIPGYSPSKWALATISKGWSRRTAVSAPAWSLLPPELIELIVAHASLGHAFEALSQTCRGLHEAILASLAVSTRQIELHIEKLKTRSISSRSSSSRGSGGGGYGSYGGFSAFGGYGSDGGYGYEY